ncbi:peptide chain release factor N(5)-glutamine methyltransferase [Testudinibacter sp. P27/CKL/0425]
MTYQQWLEQALTLLANAESPRIDSQLLLQRVTGKSRAAILAFGETVLTASEQQQLTALLQRRIDGEPMAYIFGEKAFWSLSLEVSPETLIPRPDTEILVERALAIVEQRLASPHFDGELAILDLGTGTGAIALALASELKPRLAKCGGRLKVLGVDFVAGAVTLARRNGVRNRLPEVEFAQSDWFSQIGAQKFDIIVSNPPYIDPLDQHLSQGDLRFEPHSALVANENGYADLRRIIEQAPQYLKPQGWLSLEHGWQQGQQVRSLFQQYDWQHIETVNDYGNNERVSLANLVT